MTKKNRKTPKEVYQEVAERADNGEYAQCELIYEDGERCTKPAEQMAHLDHRGAGGTTDPFIHSVENVFYYCQYHHDIHDGRTRE